MLGKSIYKLTGESSLLFFFNLFYSNLFDGSRWMVLGKLVFGSIALARPRWRPSVCIRLRSRGKTLRCTGTNKTLMPLMPYEFRCAGMIPCGGAYLRRRRC
jgi:hypothetical protein